MGLLITFILLFAACMEESSQAQDADADDAAGQEDPGMVSDEAFANGTELYAWVDDLNVRAEPNLASVVVEQLREGAQVTFSGKLGGDSTAVMLRDKAYINQFAYIRTPDGTTGWVHFSTLQEDPPQPSESLDPKALPLTLSAVRGETLEGMRWKEMYSEMGGCQGGGCPLWYSDAARSLIVIEICDPNGISEPGLLLVDKNGKQRYYRWWNEDYGTNTCHIEGKVTYQVEKLDEAGQVKELRLTYDLDPKYGEVLLELGEGEEPFVLEEKSGSR
jgi:hypothetical protein